MAMREYERARRPEYNYEHPPRRLSEAIVHSREHVEHGVEEVALYQSMPACGLRAPNWRVQLMHGKAIGL
jgi:hypothetical protein